MRNLEVVQGVFKDNNLIQNIKMVKNEVKVVQNNVENIDNLSFQEGGFKEKETLVGF